MTVSNKPAPLWNIDYNFSALYQATQQDTAARRDPREPISFSEEQLYKNILPNMFYNGNRNINYIPYNQAQFAFFRAGLRGEILGRIRSVLNFTHGLFHAHQEKLTTKHIPIFLESLGAGGQKLDPAKVKKVREKIQEFYRFTQPFLQEVWARRNQRLTIIFQKHFCHNCFRHMSELQKCHDIIALQGTLGVNELPLKMLLNIAYGEKVDDAELNEFTKKVSSCSVDIRMLHHALKAVIEYGPKVMIFPGKIPDLAELERRLFEKMPELFSQKDSRHLEWRNSLKEGSEMRTRSYGPDNKVATFRIILGKQIGIKQGSFDNNIYFEVKEFYRSERKADDVLDDLDSFETLQDEKKLDDIPATQIVWITINEAIPYVRQSIYHQHEENDSFKGIKPGRILFIDPQHSFAMVEKLHMQPLGIRKSPAENQDEYFRLISNWIKWLIKDDPKNGKEPFTPVPLLPPQSIMFNPNNTLTSVKLTDKEEFFRFAPLEEFAFHVSNGHKEVFKKIMKDSGLGAMHEALYIHNAARASFEPQKFDLIQEHRKSTSFKDKAVLHLAQNLQQELVKIRDACIKELESPPNPRMTEIDRKRLEKLLLDYYDQTGAVTLLLGTMHKDVCQAYSSRK